MEKRSNPVEGEMKLREMKIEQMQQQEKERSEPMLKFSSSVSGNAVQYRNRAVGGSRGGSAPVVAPRRSVLKKESSAPSEKKRKQKSAIPQEEMKREMEQQSLARRSSSLDEEDEEEDKMKIEKEEMMDERMDLDMEFSTSIPPSAPAPALNQRKEEEARIQMPKSDSNAMREIIKKQNANGSFSWDALVDLDLDFLFL